MHRAHGKGLSGFIFGLLCATATIMGVLYFLNHSPSSVRQSERAASSENSPVEIVRPKGAGSPLPDGRAASSAPEPLVLDEPSASLPKPSSNQTHQSDRAASSAVNTVLNHQDGDNASEPKTAPPPPRKPARQAETVVEKPTPQQILDTGNIEDAQAKVNRQRNRPAQDKTANTDDAHRASRRENPRSASKPTPQQILDAGSFEDAQAQINRQHRQQTQSNSAPQRTHHADAAQATNNRPATASGSRSVVQMGAYGSEAKAREIQQRLQSMGIRARIQPPIERNGQTIYRVRSGNMSDEDARKLADRVRSNGIDAAVIK